MDDDLKQLIQTLQKIERSNEEYVTWKTLVTAVLSAVGVTVTVFIFVFQLHQTQPHAGALLREEHLQSNLKAERELESHKLRERERMKSVEERLLILERR